MSKNIDYHEGYLQCLSDLVKWDKVPKKVFKEKQKEHTEAIGEILEEMYQEHHKKGC